MPFNPWPTQPDAPKIAAFTAYPWENALPKLRLLNPAEALGLIILPGYDYDTGAFSPETIAQANAVFIQRDFPRYHKLYAQVKDACLTHQKPIIYDIDDLLFQPVEFPTREEKEHYRPAVGLILDAIVSAHIVTTSTGYLKNELEKLASNVILAPNFIDQRKWQLTTPEKGRVSPLVIGYVGTRSHLNDLEQLAEAIEKIINAYSSQVVFYFWIESLPARLMKYSNVVWKSISLPNYDDYARWLPDQHVDIWLAPLSDTPFNRAKSPIKFLEYSSTAVPGIYSAVTPYISIVKDAENGFVASSTDEWIRKTSLLIDDPDLRLRLGLAAQKTVEQDWLLQNNLASWEQILNQLAEYKRPTHPPAHKVYQAFNLLQMHYSAEADEIKRLAQKSDEQQWLAADREDYVLQNSKLQQSFFFRLRSKFRSIQAHYFPISSLQGRIFNSMIKVGLRTINRPGPRGALTGKNPESGKFPLTPPVSLSQPLRLALYTTDNWDTASAHIRLIGPSQNLKSGVKILGGCQSSSSANLEFFGNADAVIIQRDFPRHVDAYKSLIAWASQNNKPVIYEIDDLLYEIPDDHPEKWYYRKCENLIRSAVADAHAVITSTQTLAREIRKINANTWFLPNYLDDNIWRLEPVNDNPDSGRIVIGYMAGITRTHVPDFNYLIDLLVDFLRRYPDRLELHFWGGVDDTRAADPHIIYHQQRYTSYKEFATYFSTQKADIFVAPLSPSTFNDCKSPIKFLEYSSLGVPGVYSNVPSYQDVIEHGKNGFLASSLSEWETCIQQLIENDQLRRKIGIAAYKTVNNQYLMSRHATEWARTYSAAIMQSFFAGKSGSS